MEKTIAWPDIILVNGPSSAGKTTLCRALQDRILHPYLCIGFDDFVATTPPRYYRGAGQVGVEPGAAAAAEADNGRFTNEGVRMDLVSKPGEPPCVVARFGPVFRRLLNAMAPAVRTLVDAGNSVIFDHVLHDAAMHESCQRAFHGLRVFNVGVFCRLELLEARERARGDRIIGRARGLLPIVHSFCAYDIEVDTGLLSTEASVDKIIDAVHSSPP